ncbi:MAG: maltose/moltooligosaccharide transporter [Paraglaciecola sp.]|jgi:maltose/moltooligosaccharide transporter
MQRTKPELNFWQIWNMCFGFLGIQFGFALQNSNVSRIFEALGADYSNLAVLWVAAPITGLIVQPIIGYMSDHTWNRLGRRRPYFLWGAIAASAALFIMPNSPSLWFAAGMLWIMDASINVSMEPFRAFVGDMLPKKQRATGYAMQTFFIGVGAVVASALPWMMTNWFEISNVAAAGIVPDSVKFSFYAGGAIFLSAVLWTVYSTKEYSPEQLKAFEEIQALSATESAQLNTVRTANQYLKGGVIYGLIGIVLYLIISINIEMLDKNLYILAAGLGGFGICQLFAAYLSDKGKVDNGFSEVMGDLFAMPQAMRQLAVVQFFSWFPLFSMWIYTNSAVTSHHYGTTDVTSAVYNQGADWVSILMATYNGVSIFAAIIIPIVVKVSNLQFAHLINLTLGGIGFISFLFIKDPAWLVLSMVGVGFAWASILSVPYAILSNVLPVHKMGVYMGIFNFFIVIPQILAASILGFLITKVFDNEPVYALVIGGCSMLIAGLMTLRVKIPE